MVNVEDISRLLNSGVESVAQMSIGQAVLRIADKILWTVEKSIQWSLPRPEPTEEENGKTFGTVELVRPLPWIVFLPSLLFLRMLRIGINVTAFVLGYPQVGPTDMIRVIQRGRRRIRAVRSTGLKNMRLKRCSPNKDRAMSMKEASKSLARSIRLTLSTLSCLDSGSKTSPSPPPTKIRVSNILDSIASVTEEKGPDDVAQETKRKYSELSSDDESDLEPLIDRIDRLATDSTSDSSFCPCDQSVVTESDSESEADMSIPMSELNDLRKESEEAEKIWCNNSAPLEAQSDIELHKPNKEEKFPVAEKPPLSLTEELEKMATITSALATDHEVHSATTNGVGGNDQDTAYYSPISWKSVSPDISITYDKQDNQFDIDGKSEELSNGEVTDEKEKEDSDNVKPRAEAAGDEVTNGHVKEKQRTSSQSGGSSSNKHQQKNKRGNHGNRKKK